MVKRKETPVELEKLVRVSQNLPVSIKLSRRKMMSLNAFKDFETTLLERGLSASDVIFAS